MLTLSRNTDDQIELPPNTSPPARQQLFAFLTLATVCLVFCSPLLLPSVARSPTSDFDSHLVPYAAILHDSGAWQWNTAYGLGQPALADPLTNLFNPLAAVVLLGLGPEHGLGPLLFIALLLTSLVTRQLCRELGCRGFAATFGGLAFTLSGFVAGHLFAGHLEFILSLPALPLAWIAGRRLGCQTRQAIVLGAVAIALPLLSGAAYFAEYSAVILTGLMLVRCAGAAGQAQRVAVIAGTGGALLLGAGLGAVHVLPMTSLIGQLTRMPISPAGSMPPLSALWSLLLPPWLLADKGIDAWLEGQPAPTVGWYELTAYLGPFVLAPFLGMPLAWRSRRRLAIIEALAVVVMAALLLDARSPLLPAYWLLHKIPETLALRVPARSLGLIALAVAALCAIGLDALLETAKEQAARRWRQLSVLAIASLLPVTGFVLVGQAYVAQQTTRSPIIRPAQGNTLRVLISGEISQLALVQQGAAILNDYYGWHLPPALNLAVLDDVATGAALRPGATLIYNSITPLPPPDWATVQGTELPSNAIRLIAHQGAPAAFLTSNACQDLPCPVQQVVHIVHWGQTTVIDANATPGQLLVVTEAAAPGWQVRLDAGAARPLPANGRVLMVPAVPGPHRYLFQYATPHLTLGALVTLGSAVLCGLLRRSRRSLNPIAASP